jgi:deoxyribose-phosphate aldolase
MGTSAIRNLDDVLNMLDAKPDKLAISRAGFFQTFEEVRALERIRLTKKELAHNVAGMIWHPKISQVEVRQYLKEAKHAGLYGVSVDPRWAPLATEVLDDSTTKVIVRAGYPFGNTPTDLKVAEVEWVVKNSALTLEIQTALNTSAFKSGHYDYIRQELDALVKASNGRSLSVILQTPLLSTAEIAAACLMCIACGVSYIEPIHGFLKFSADGSTITADRVNYLDVRLMKKIVGDKIGIKATGAVSHVIDALVLFSNGAKRVTTPEAISMLADYDAMVNRVEPYGK